MSADYDELVNRLRSLAKAYPVDMFSPVSAEETKAHANLITRASAAFGRHFSPIFDEAADAIEALTKDRNP